MGKKKIKAFIIYICILVLLLFIEIGARIYISSGRGPDLEAYTSMKQNEPRYIAAPYLNYINNSRFLNEAGEKDFNSLGLKNHSETSLEKPADVYRILFLGGSTTFGMVKDARNTFPYLIEQSLNTQIGTLNSNYSKVECLNGGLCGGTSAEILTHYLLKLNYLRPDLLVIHAGLNDAVTYLPLGNSQYHPDYHNRRSMFPDIKPLNNRLHFLLKSEAACLLIYYIKYRKYVEGTLESNLFFKFDNNNEWLPYGNDSMYSTRYNAFHSNIKNIITVAKVNHQKVVLVTEVVDEQQILSISAIPDSIMKILVEGFQKNKEFLQKLSTELNTPLCELSSKEFPPEMFPDNDGIHVNERGERVKAKMIEKFIIECIRN